MALYLGIDGGGTHTRALICDEKGCPLGSGSGGVSNYHHAGWDAAARAVAEAVIAARMAAQRGTERFASVFLGMAGVATDEARAKWRGVISELGILMQAERIGVDHDIAIALAGGLAGRPGIAVVAGTGSAAYGRNANGDTWKSGGWGALLDDGGSGYWLGVQALSAAIRAEDGRGPATALGGRALTRLGATSLRDAMTRMISGALRRHEIARVSADVVEAAAAGDGVAQRILEQGAEELALMVRAVAGRIFAGGSPEVVLTGSTAQAAGYGAAIQRAIVRAVPTARLATPEMPPVAGAAWWALRQDGLDVATDGLARLRQAPTDHVASASRERPGRRSENLDPTPIAPP